MYLYLLALLSLECLSSAVLLFQLDHQVVMHSILGGIHLLACITLIATAFARVFSPMLLACIGTLSFLTFLVSVSNRLIDWIDISSCILLFTCVLTVATHVRYEPA